jgi:uncharacterized protein YoxC
LSDIKNIDVILRETKTTLMKRMDTLKQDIDDKFEANNPDKVEKKMIERMNDAVVVLTRTMADKADTKKNLRLLEKQIFNVFKIALHSLKGSKPLPKNVISQAE